MIGCDLVAAALLASVPIAATSGVLTIAQLLAVSCGVGCVNVLFNTSYGRFLLDLVEDPADRATANGLLQGSASAARIAGFGLGGTLVVTIGVTHAMAADACSFLVSAGCLAALSLREARPKLEQAHTSWLRKVADGVSFSFGDPLMRPLVLYGGTSNLALVGYQALLVVFLVRSAHVGSGTIGVLLTFIACGGVAGAFCGNAIARWLGSGRALFILKVGACPFALLIPLTAHGPREVLVVLGGLGVGFGIVAGNVVSSSFWQNYTPRDLVARASASQNVFNYGTMPVGALLAGTLATLVGLHNAMWAMTALLPVTSLWLVFSPFVRLRVLPTEQATWPRPSQKLESTVIGSPT